jgi:7-carboxy-7-deazaguanine synthase
MLISETFYSIQGEGELTGVPSFFIRTSGCNLRCAWCDTPYASWRPEGKQRSVDQLVAEVRAQPGRHVVLTGGEPMIAPELPVLAAALRAAGFHITIETAGTVAPAGIACDLASISPKLANSTPTLEAAGEGWVSRHEATRWQPHVLRAWLAAYDYQLKFVAAAPADLDEISARLAELTGRGAGVKIPAHKVLVMPEGTTMERLRSRADWLGEACKARGWRYAHRLHVELYGNKRGS